MVYVVLGMHKSGTTLISEILHHSGINMGDFDQSMSYDSGNKYERKETKELNHEMLSCRKNTYSLNVIKPVGKDSFGKNHLKRIGSLIRELNNRHDNWGFKDPRSCLTFSVWKECLPEYRLIVVYREPVEIYLYYKRKNPKLLAFLIPRICWKSIAAWYAYYENILRYIGNLRREQFIIISYNKFMSSTTEFKRLEDFVGFPLNDRRKKGLYRERKKKCLLFEVSRRIQKRILSKDMDAILEILYMRGYS